jgi:hypothetical protein
MTFDPPRYRRTATGANRYRIEADDRFTELQRLGRRWLVHVVRDAPYPERVRIAEMIDGLGGTFLEDDPATFERLLLEAEGQG